MASSIAGTEGGGGSDQWSHKDRRVLPATVVALAGVLEAPSKPNPGACSWNFLEIYLHAMAAAGIGYNEHAADGIMELRSLY